MKPSGRLARHAPLLLVLFFVACGNPPNSGYVTSRTFTAAHYEDWTDSVCISRDPKTSVCTFSVPQHHHDYHPDVWTLCLKRDEGDTKHDETGCWAVDQATYDRYPVGAHYPDAR